MCIFGGGGGGSTPTGPTVYDGRGRARATDRSYRSVKDALRAQRRRNWEYPPEEQPVAAGWTPTSSSGRYPGKTSLSPTRLYRK